MTRWRCALCPAKGAAATKKAAMRELLEHEHAAHPTCAMFDVRVGRDGKPRFVAGESA